MTYSRRRLIGIACFWLFAGLMASAMYGVPVDTVPQAEAQGNCGAEPCMFPVEAHVGGIVLGVATLEGQAITTFGTDGTGVNTPLAPERVDDYTVSGEGVDEAIGAGLNDLEANQFFLYKSWKYEDPQATDADVNVWITADQASLKTEDGSTGCGNNNQNFAGSAKCDLLIYTNEFSAGYFTAEVSLNTDQGVCDPIIVLCGPFDNTQVSSGEYWIDDPEDDTCPLIDIGRLPSLPVSICLELVSDGGVQSRDAIDSIDPTIRNLLLRTSYAKAVPTNGKDKLFSLTDGYLEIRHGKGADRSRIKQGDTAQSPQRGDEWQTPITPGDGAPTGTSGMTRRHGVSQGFRCQGGPDGDTDCDPDDQPTGTDGERTGPGEGDGAYDDVHR